MDSLDNVLSEIDALLDSYPNKNPLSESEGVGKDLSFCGKVEEGKRETRKRLHRTGEIDIDMVELDDLVRSVEVEFASVNSINNALLDSETRAQREIQQTQLHQQRQPIARQISTSHSVKDEDVDFILESLQEELLHQEEEYLSDLVNEGAADIMRDSQTRLRKCQEVYLGSKNELRGASSSVEPRCCDALRCTKCDLRVMYFHDHSWDQSSDYLFFRNNYPETVEQKLVHDEDYTAYCCQCSWISLKIRQNLGEHNSTKELDWVCAGHDSQPV